MHQSPCLLLIRHAQSENNAHPDELRVPDPDITELGVMQAKKLAPTVNKLNPTVIYCSPFLRSLETTRWIAEKSNVVPIVRQDIYEQGGCHRGYEPGKQIAVAGMNRSTLETKYSGWRLDDRINEEGWYDVGHYESREEAARRAQSVRRWFESETQLHNEQDRVAMIIHADFVLRLMEAFLEDDTIEEQLGDIINTSITRLSKHRGRWRIDYWNVFIHLDTDEISC
jgi:2,3-bisphosphoglycerate-dependent phosphoglycerate mutase